jgi:hypothetical protein
MNQKIKKQKGFIPIIIAIVVIILAGIGMSYGIGYSRASNIIREAKQLAKEEKYDKAIELLEVNQNKWFIKNLGIKKQAINSEIEKNKKLLEDKTEYTQGIEEFEKGNFENAKELLSKVSEDFPHYQEVKNKIEETERKITEEQVAETTTEVEKEITKATCQDECSQIGLKKCYNIGNFGYQTCGNYDSDSCLEWSSTTICPPDTITCQNGICIQQEQKGQKCSDGTLFNQCSTNKPFYCENGNLINKCSTCGCPSGKQCQSNGSCTVSPQATCQNECSQVGLKRCSDNGYQVCGNYDTDNCLEWSSITNCSVNTICQSGNCVPQKCSHWIPYSQVCGNIKVAIIEFKFVGDPKVDFSYEFCCDEGNCIFKLIPDYLLIGGEWVLQEYNPNWCNKTKIRYTFEDVFNNPEGITKIYPTRSSVPQYTYYSIYKLKEFYENEAKKYGVDLNIDLDVKGPYILSSKPPQRLRDESPALLEEFFDKEAQKYNISLQDYDVINYVYFTSENYIVSTVTNKKTFNQAIISFDEFFSNIMTITHEMGHVFGAGDTYEPGTWSCRYPEGYPEPNKKPLYPQSKACLMCKSIMIEEKFSRAPQDFSELVICDEEARLFGWK